MKVDKTSYNISNKRYMKHYLIFLFAVIISFTACADKQSVPKRKSALFSISGWDSLFIYQYDYVLKETSGLKRTAEPVKVTLSAKPGEIKNWTNEIRVVRWDSVQPPELIPFQVYGKETADKPPTESVNIVFIAKALPYQKINYKIFWGKCSDKVLPSAEQPTDLKLTGLKPGLTINNRYYHIELSEKSGAIQTARRASQGNEELISFYQGVPIHFGADVWSPPVSWDHDYDWKTPPNQQLIHGPIMIKYHRWGPLKSYQDVIVHLTYTFFTNVPYVVVSTIMEFTENRSARAVRMGEIVVTYMPSKEHPDYSKINSSDNVFTHYAWPEGERIVTRDIASHLDSKKVAQIEGFARGGLAVLDRDIPWVAGYNKLKKFGMASLRKSHFVGNKYGNPLPFTAACTYLGQYGWGFTYWSRPEVYPFGKRNTMLDHNTVVSKGTIFLSEEALLIFDPTNINKNIRNVYTKYTHPLKLQFKGTGPW